MKVEKDQKYHMPADVDYSYLMERPIRVLVECEGYVMVRRKGCVPFVVSTEDMRDWVLIDD